jgi:hypothetical protein
MPESVTHTRQDSRGWSADSMQRLNQSIWVNDDGNLQRSDCGFPRSHVGFRRSSSATSFSFHCAHSSGV